MFHVPLFQKLNGTFAYFLTFCTIYKWSFLVDKFWMAICWIDNYIWMNSELTKIFYKHLSVLFATCQYYHACHFLWKTNCPTVTIGIQCILERDLMSYQNLTHLQKSQLYNILFCFTDYIVDHHITFYLQHVYMYVFMYACMSLLNRLKVIHNVSDRV